MQCLVFGPVHHTHPDLVCQMTCTEYLQRKCGMWMHNHVSWSGLSSAQRANASSAEERSPLFSSDCSLSALPLSTFRHICTWVCSWVKSTFTSSKLDISFHHLLITTDEAFKKIQWHITANTHLMVEMWTDTNNPLCYSSSMNLSHMVLIWHHSYHPVQALFLDVK